jgi:cell division septation protein DedD
MKRVLSSPFFLIAAVAFLLPFFSVQCAGGGNLGDLGIPTGEAELEQDVTGLELVTGEAEDKFESEAQNPAVPEIPGLESPIPIPTPTGPAQEVDLGTVQIFAIAAAAIAVLGILLSLLGGRTGGAVALLLGIAGGAVLFLTFTEFKDAILGEAAGQLEGLIEVKQESGFWLAIVGFGIAAVTGLVRLLMPGGPRAARPAPVTAGSASGFGPPPAAPPPAQPPPSTPPPATPPPATPPPATPPPAAPPPSTPPPATPPPRPPEESPPA